MTKRKPGYALLLCGCIGVNPSLTGYMQNAVAIACHSFIAIVNILPVKLGPGLLLGDSSPGGDKEDAVLVRRP
jgi:hypothetical protein